MGALCVSEQKKSINDERIKAKLALKKEINGLAIYLYHGDIFEETVDAIVTGVDNSGNATNQLKPGKGNKKIDENSLKIQGSVPGRAFHTSAGNLKSKHLIYIVLPTWRGGEFDEIQQIKEGVKNTFILAEELKLRTLSFGELSSGINSIPTKTLANILLKTTIEYAETSKDALITTVNFIHMDNKCVKIFTDELDDLFKEEIALFRNPNSETGTGSTEPNKHEHHGADAHVHEHSKKEAILEQPLLAENQVVLAENAVVQEEEKELLVEKAEQIVEQVENLPKEDLKELASPEKIVAEEEEVYNPVSEQTNIIAVVAENLEKKLEDAAAEEKVQVVEVEQEKPQATEVQQEQKPVQVEEEQKKEEVAEQKIAENEPEIINNDNNNKENVDVQANAESNNNNNEAPEVNQNPIESNQVESNANQEVNGGDAGAQE